MTDFDSVDYFTDQSLVADPYPYFDYLRSRCPVRREPGGLEHVPVAQNSLEFLDGMFMPTSRIAAGNPARMC